MVLRTAAGYRFAVTCASDRLDPHKAADALQLSRQEPRFANDLHFAYELEMAADFPGRS